MKLLKRLVSRGSMFSDVALTSVVGMVVMVLTIVSQGIAARILSPEELSGYLMIRKANVALVPLVVLGMSMALSRHMPMFAGQGRAGRKRLATITMGVVFLSCSVFITVLLLYRVGVSTLLFKSPDHQEWIPGLAYFLCGMVCITIVGAYFQGRMWMKIVNIMQFTAIGLVQLIVLVKLGDLGLAKIMETIGLGIFACAMLFLAFAIYDSNFGSDEGTGEQVPPMLTSLKGMLVYGLPRVPSFLAMGGLWLLSPLLVVQLSDLASGRYIVTALNLLNFVAVPFTPMTVVFLPRFAEMKAQGKFEEMSKLASMLTDSLVQLGLLGASQIVIFIPLILRAWMEFTDPKAYLYATIIALAIPAFLVFQVLRNPIDSFTSVPVNTYTIISALLLLGILAWVFSKLMDPELAVAWATSLAFIALGAATYTLARRLLVIPGTVHGNRGYIYSLLIISLLYPVGLGIKAAILSLGTALQLGIVTLWALIVVTVFVALQVKLRVVWAGELADRIRTRL